MKHTLTELGGDNAYLAGMRKDTLPASLLWIVIQTGTKPTEYLALLELGLKQRAEEFDNGILCDFISGTCQLNDIGKPIGGHIILMGKLLVANFPMILNGPLKVL
ncbi:unnamed protein product [Clonostachys chloroleuca]|uniref:Uncharacterized protein n=1 Tax=Clonostachys chloroleuca TaxID=1926264 RepID=A0AA35M2R1_9HYPO|nr:unnamed protein product [Clonostachys chloroleuca]